MKFRFDENDDLIVDDIPDDLMDLVAQRAEQHGIGVEDVWRNLIVRLVSPDLSSIT